ncbi:hypothetical protein [Azospirillum sp. B506]|uniref:hypothetical protein n=1 Tax=Azospirillum sp. B506 TaxID=137721 RepID=UPI0011DE3B17|nr:hypothetical protein [Azospirillum sp. B506]
MLGLLLWSDAAAAACPHERQEAGVAVAAPPHMPYRIDIGMPDSGHHMPGRQHHAVQPCCAGMVCAAVAVALPGAEVASPVGVAGLRLAWAAGPLREGLGVRPDLPPPRLG